MRGNAHVRFGAAGRENGPIRKHGAAPQPDLSILSRYVIGRMLARGRAE